MHVAYPLVCYCLITCSDQVCLVCDLLLQILTCCVGREDIQCSGVEPSLRVSEREKQDRIQLFLLLTMQYHVEGCQVGTIKVYQDDSRKCYYDSLKMYKVKNQGV